MKVFQQQGSKLKTKQAELAEALIIKHYIKNDQVDIGGGFKNGLPSNKVFLILLPDAAIKYLIMSKAIRDYY